MHNVHANNIPDTYAFASGKFMDMQIIDHRSTSVFLSHFYYVNFSLKCIT